MVRFIEDSTGLQHLLSEQAPKLMNAPPFLNLLETKDSVCFFFISELLELLVVCSGMS